MSETPYLQKPPLVGNDTAETKWYIEVWKKLGRAGALLGSIRFGNDTNYSEFEADGTICAHGDATCWNDTMSPSSNMRKGGTALPFDLLSGTGATANYQYRFDTLDEVYTTLQMPHNMKVQSEIYPHLHIVNRTALTGAASTLHFTLYYAWANIQTTFGATAGVINYANLPGSLDLRNLGQFYHGLVNFGAITPGAGQGNISSILLLKIIRNNAGTNVYSGNEIFTLGFDIHYEIDTLGSRQAFIK